MSDFLFPDVGEGINEGKLVHWKIKEGDNVKQDQVLCDVETDKAVVEIPSPKSGVVSKLYYKEGDVMKVGTPLIAYSDGQNSGNNNTTGAQSAPPPPSEFKRPIEQGTVKVESNLVPLPPTPEQHEPPIPSPHIDTASTIDQQGPVVQNNNRVLATPSTRHLAREKGVDIQSIKGTGPAGRVTADDVLAAAGGGARPATTTATATQTNTTQTNSTMNAPFSSAQPATITPGSKIPYSGRRKVIGDHMTQAQGIPSVTEFAEADVTKLSELRERFKTHAGAQGIKLTPLPIFVKALCAAIRKHPVVNSVLTQTEIIVANEIHIGIAVDAPKGLVVPVVQNADKKSVLDIAREINALADAAKQDKLTIQQMKGSTFSVSSIGPLRVQGFTPMINTPESAILGIGAIQDKPWVIEGKVVPRKIVTLSLTFDHRVFDGAEAARFLTDLVLLLEDPDLLLLGGL